MGVGDNKSYKICTILGKYYQNDPSKLPSLHNDNPKSMILLMRTLMQLM